MAWIVDGKGIATKVKNASLSSPLQIKDSGAFIKCPNCSHRIDNSNVLIPWPGLPKGVKFEPTDEDIIEFLETKFGINDSKPHPLIEEFIRPVTEDVGINYIHPQNLRGANKDGASVFFSHKTVQAYGTGQRKRQNITPTCLNDEPVRWHKTAYAFVYFKDDRDAEVAIRRLDNTIRHQLRSHKNKRTRHLKTL